jgi:hypothetical protein
MRGIWVAVLAAAFLVGAAVTASGQAGSVAPVTPAKSGMVSYIQGAVYVDDALIPDPIVAQFPYMKEGGNLRTAEGRAEVVMNPGVMARVGENSTLRMITNRFIDTRVELMQGAATVQLLEAEKDNSFTLVCKDATVAISKAGFYHFYAEPAAIKVFSGEARVTIGDQNIEVPAGKMLQFNGGNASVQKFDKQETDALDNWSGRRGELVSAANASAARNCGNGTGTGYTTIRPYGFAQGVPGNGYISNTPCQGNWNWNPYYSMWTYVPFMNRYCDPFWGYCYYNPMGAWNYFYQPRPIYYNPGLPGSPTATRTGPTTGGGVGTGLGPAARAAASAPAFGGGSSRAATGGMGMTGGGGASAGPSVGSTGGASAGAAAATGHGAAVSAGGGKR